MQPATLVKTAIEGLDDADIMEVHRHIVSIASNRGVDLSDGNGAASSPLLVSFGTPMATPVASMRRKGPKTWAKKVDKVDWSKRGGYAIEGKFINAAAFAGLAPGTLVVMAHMVGDDKKYGLFEADPTVATTAWEGGSLPGVKLLAATGHKGALSLPPGIAEPDGFGNMQEVVVELKARGM